ncbi:MAG: AAA family ATPase [Bacteroidales bacterium]|nr:AAA family ATPase [Bacteroidales bacterium]
MTLVIDNIPIDENNPEFRYAAEFVLHTNRMLYLTGKAGTGKTTFLKLLKHISNKNMVVLAPTGVAAVNAGGQTIHSFFNIKPSVYVPGDKRLRVRVPPDDPDKSMINDHFRYHRDKLEIIRGLELLVIDEISMVRCDLLDVIDRLLRVFRKREFTPFGGVQVVLIGDTFQLPPIVNQDDWSILGQFYKSPFFFSSRALQDQKPVYIELKKIYRQTDQDFIDLLNRIRINSLDPGDLNLLNSRFLHGFTPEQEEDYIILATHNRMVEETNEMRLREINEPLHRFEAMVDGIFPEHSYPADAMLKLKEGAQVMFLRNDRNKRFYNGKIGHVIEISEEGLFVELPEGDIISVEREEWANIRYSWDSKESKVIEDPVGSFVQYPLKLAWAITVHKSQGLTFEKIIADLGEAFAPGQVYVALSRCTSFPGVLLKTPLTGRAIMTDPVVLEFAGNETPETLIISELEKGKADNFLKRALTAYRIRDYQKAGTLFLAYMEQPSEKGYEKGIRLLTYAIDRFITAVKKMQLPAFPESGMPASVAFPVEQKSMSLPDQRKELRQLEVKIQAQLLLAETMKDVLHNIPPDKVPPGFQAGNTTLIGQVDGSLSVALKVVKDRKKKSGRKK